MYSWTSWQKGMCLNGYYILVFVKDEYDKYHHNPFPSCDIYNKK
jgi:hypothetical protein